MSSSSPVGLVFDALVPAHMTGWSVLLLDVLVQRPIHNFTDRVVYLLSNFLVLSFLVLLGFDQDVARTRQLLDARCEEP